jgi:hypothetical protein
LNIGSHFSEQDGIAPAIDERQAEKKQEESQSKKGGIGA